MWLAKDERSTLLKYYNYLQGTQEYTKFIALPERTYNSTHNLINRGLLHEISEHGPEHVEYLAASMAKDPINLMNFFPSLF